MRTRPELLGANEGRIEGTLVRRRDGKEDQPTIPYDELARAIWKQRGAYFEIRDSDPNKSTRAIRRRSLGASYPAIVAGSTLVGERELERSAWTVEMCAGQNL